MSDLDEYALAHAACPHCSTGMLLGVPDPEHEFDGEVDIALISPGSVSFPMGEKEARHALETTIACMRRTRAELDGLPGEDARLLEAAEARAADALAGLGDG